MAISCIWQMFALLIPMAHIVNTGQISYNFQIHFRHFGLDAWAQFEKLCANGTKLLILTMSRREGFDSRRGIRTWMKDALAGEELRFLIAGPGKDEADDVQQKLVNEQKEHGDLVLLHGFVDVYAHLHIKMYSGFVWQQRHCAGAEWVLKVDDDIAVHVRRMVEWTEKKFGKMAIEHPLIYFGVPADRGLSRDKNSKWYVPYEMFPGKHFPPFLYGGCYLTTPSTIKAVLEQAQNTDSFYLEDVLYTGILAELANVTVSDQLSHFYGNGLQFECVDRLPTPFAVWNTDNGNETVRYYEELKKMSCEH